jgi:16S rRNA (uracil1498-N3)-methyltransferase
MRLHRFYINQKIGKEIRIEDRELLHQWQKVFRLKASDRVIVFNGGNSEYEGYFKILAKNEAVIVIDKEREVKNLNKIELHIFQSIIKKDNFEFVVEKCTEIGVTAFHPIISERSEKKDLNIERLNKIAKEAAEQSGKTKLPAIFTPESLVKTIKAFDGELFALDFDGADFSKTFLTIKEGKVGILIGPEGGWSDNEKMVFEEMGINSFSLGLQILRAETAAIAASALILIK